MNNDRLQKELEGVNLKVCTHTIFYNHSLLLVTRGFGVFLFLSLWSTDHPLG